MKKRIILSLFACFAFATAFAQEGAKIGFRASPLISTGVITSDSTKTKPDGLDTKAKLGFAFDFVFTYGFSENIALRTGISIATKGFKTTTEFGSDVLNSKMNFTAVEVPIGLKFRSPEIGDGMYIVGFFGVTPEINVQNKQVFDVIAVDSVGGITIERDVERVDVDGVNFFTASFVPGVGFDWEFDWGMLEFGFNYHWGLMSYVNKNSLNFNDLRIRMNVFSLNLGYYF